MCNKLINITAFAQLRCITCENCAQIPANPQTQICSHDPPSIDTTTTISLPETSPTQPGKDKTLKKSYENLWNRSGGGPILTNPTQTVPTTTLPTVSTVPTNPTLPGLTSGTTVTIFKS